MLVMGIDVSQLFLLSPLLILHSKERVGRVYQPSWKGNVENFWFLARFQSYSLKPLACQEYSNLDLSSLEEFYGIRLSTSSETQTFDRRINSRARTSSSREAIAAATTADDIQALEAGAHWVCWKCSRKLIDRTFLNTCNTPSGPPSAADRRTQ